MAEYDLYHYGITGQKWGIRRFQYEDGSLTPEGKKRYGVDSDGSITNRRKYARDSKKELNGLQQSWLEEQRILNKNGYDSESEEYIKKQNKYIKERDAIIKDLTEKHFDVSTKKATRYIQSTSEVGRGLDNAVQVATYVPGYIAGLIGGPSTAFAAGAISGALSVPLRMATGTTLQKDIKYKVKNNKE